MALQLLAVGYTAAQIAALRGVYVVEVLRHLRAAVGALGVSTVAAAVNEALAGSSSRGARRLLEITTAAPTRERRRRGGQR